MVQFTFREEAESLAARAVPPDLVWQDGARADAAIGFADFALARDDESGNLKGLQSVSPLETAILIQLFTDARDDGPDAEERRGWFGDAFDIDSLAHEGPLGSLLWTLERAALTPESGLQAASFAQAALQTFVDQGLVQRFDVGHEIDAAAGVLALRIRAVGETGNLIFDRRIGVSGNV